MPDNSRLKRKVYRDQEQENLMYIPPPKHDDETLLQLILKQHPSLTRDQAIKEMQDSGFL